ncbi:gamma-glutamylcyclotransferase, partial [Myxococcus sp. AM011]|uniref:gamma-glutamylcyclotransferase n=2 Tax=Myxococcus TaxID=32 RepID=UPI00159619BE
VFGRLFEIQGQDWPIVQHKEGFVTGMCVERTVKVLVDGQEVEATAFVTNPRRAAQDGPVSPRFVEALVRGAQAAGLPADYVERLKRGGA